MSEPARAPKKLGDAERENAIIAEAKTIRAKRAAERSEALWLFHSVPSDETQLLDLPEFSNSDFHTLSVDEIATVGELRRALQARRDGGHCQLTWVHGRRVSIWQKIVDGYRRRATLAREAKLAAKRERPYIILKEYKSGKSVDQIATDRGLSMTTIKQNIEYAEMLLELHEARIADRLSPSEPDV